MVYLYWRWPGDRKDEHGRPITERCAPYASLDDAYGQASYDLDVCVAADDYAAAPQRIMDAGGVELWSAPLPEGR
ncbi:hypothetical protein [Sphaerisporangium aureirubrum]|uniref:Uncharacterized protein n=1 Tax=Sphaerisporangium aureirubrum TaxID=1544736 RepID=A0ABW1NC91_9ACTN